MRILQPLGWGLALVALGACGGSHREAPATDPGARAVAVEDAARASSEAERTRAMEEQATQMNRELEEAQASGASGADAEAAYQKFERERAQLNQTAEGGDDEGNP